jgi:hypothetical protein
VRASSSASGGAPLALKPGVPEVDGLERPPEPRHDHLGDPRHQRRAQHLLEQRLHARLGQLAADLEAAGDRGRGEGHEGVLAAGGVELGEQLRVADIGLARAVEDHRTRRRVGLDAVRGGRRHQVRDRVPVDPRVVDHRRGDRLGDDALHHRDDQPLAREPLGIAVAALELVAQVPVADQPQPRREQPGAASVDQ